MMTSAEKQVDRLYIGERVIDLDGHKGIVVDVKPGTDNDAHGTVAVWQLDRDEYGADNCEHYPEFGWRNSLKRLGPEPTFLYAVRQVSNGQFYKTHTNNRSAGFVETLGEARTWTKRGQARSKATSLGFGVEIVEFVSFTVFVHDQTARLKKLNDQKQQNDLKKRAAHEKWALEQAQRDAERATERLHALEKKMGRRP